MMTQDSRVSGSPSWGRWPPQQPVSGYAMMDASVLAPYEAGPRGTAPTHRPEMAHQYMMGQEYGMAAVPDLHVPHYQHQQDLDYSPYTPPPTSPSVPSFRPYLEQRPVPSMMANDRIDTHVNYEPRRSRKAHWRSQNQSPLIKCEQRFQGEASTIDLPTEPKAVTPNTTVDGATAPIFETEIDLLMKAIQLRDEAEKTANLQQSGYPSPPQSEQSEDGSRSSSPDEVTASAGQATKKPVKKYKCDFPNCDRRSAQKTHMETHRLSHTGEKPHVCPYCKKTASQAGNLTTHQNKVHRDEVRALRLRFDDFQSVERVPEKERALFSVFRSLYKNSCKGIKGRGRNCYVEKIRTQVAPRAAVVPSHHAVQQHHQAVRHIPHDTSFTPQGPPMDAGRYATPRDHRNAYESYGIDQVGVSAYSAATGSSSHGTTMYEEDPSRGLAYQHRFY